jgi:hypothetical protein
VDFVNDNRGKINLVARLAPLVFAELSPAAVQRLAALPEVDAIYLETLTRDYELDTAVLTHLAERPWGWHVIGQNARACVIEPDGIAWNNPYLAFGEYFDPAVPVYVDYHATGIAGIIQSEAFSDYYPVLGAYRDMRGPAWGALPILSGNATGWSDSELVAATDWCVMDNVPQAHVVNHSYGDTDANRNMTAMDRYLDYLVRYQYVLQVKSAGNRGTGDGIVSSPGKGWNTFTVGSIDDQDTWYASDDVLSDYTSYVDPYVPGSTATIDKPEIVAVGCHDSWVYPSVGLRATDYLNPWLTNSIGCGTSYSAPMVVATALQVMQKNPDLKIWPEAVKAIIMAGAVNNMEGARCCGDKDGAGRLRTELATNNIAALPPGSRYTYGGFDPSTFGTQTKLSFSKVAGKRIKCALVWDAVADDYGASSPSHSLQTDLDLAVRRASDNVLVGYSGSVYNAWESVDVDVPTTGTYNVEVRVWSTSETSNYYGLACWNAP